MYSENCPEKLDNMKWNENGPKTSKKYKKISKVNEIWNIVPGMMFYILSVFNFQKMAKNCMTISFLPGYSWHVLGCDLTKSHMCFIKKFLPIQ